MPDALKERLEAFVPPPVSAEVTSLEEFPTVYERPYERWATTTKKKEQGTESIPLTVRETERVGQRELLSVLRLVDAGKVAVSGTTRWASSATIDAVTAVLEGGDYYPYRPPQDKWHDENAGPIRAFAWPLIIQAGERRQARGRRNGRDTRRGRRRRHPLRVTLRLAAWPRVDLRLLLRLETLAHEGLALVSVQVLG